MKRPSIHRTLMDTARVWSKRSTCSRANVGAVLAVGGQVISAGYNGAPAGLPHCDHGKYDGTLMDPHVDFVDNKPHCNNAVHAEVNALLSAARHGHRASGSVLYTTLFPCYRCAGLLVNAGVSEVIWLKMYSDVSRSLEIFHTAGVDVKSLKHAERETLKGAR